MNPTTVAQDLRRLDPTGALDQALAMDRVGLASETRGPAFTHSMRSAMLHLAADEGAAWLYRTEQVITGSTRHERFDQLSTLEQDQYRKQARRVIMGRLDALAAARAESGAIQWAKLTNDWLAEPDAVQELCRQSCSDALSVVDRYLDDEWRQVVRA